MPYYLTTTLARWLLAAALAVTTLVLVPPDSQAAAYVDWGRTAAHDQRYRPVACHGYRYRYRINPPENDWHLEVWLVSPNGRKIASDLFHFDSDPNRGRARFKVCGSKTTPGRHVIKGKVTYGANEVERRLEPTRFRLYRG